MPFKNSKQRAAFFANLKKKKDPNSAPGLVVQDKALGKISLPPEPASEVINPYKDLKPNRFKKLKQLMKVPKVK